MSGVSVLVYTVSAVAATIARIGEGRATWVGSGAPTAPYLRR